MIVNEPESLVVRAQILSSIALSGRVVALTFIFSVKKKKSNGYIVHYVYLHKVYIKLNADSWRVNYSFSLDLLVCRNIFSDILTVTALQRSYMLRHLTENYQVDQHKQKGNAPDQVKCDVML